MWGPLLLRCRRGANAVRYRRRHRTGSNACLQTESRSPASARWRDGWKSAVQAGISRARSRSYRVAHVLLALLQNRQGCELSRHPADVVLRGEKVRLRPSTRGCSRNELKQRYRWSKDTRLQYWSGPLLTDRSFRRFRRTLPERDWPRDGQLFSYAILTL